MACHVGDKRGNELGLCDFIDVVGVYWFSWFRGVVKWGQWIGAFCTRSFAIFVKLTGSFGFAVILTDTAFLIRGNRVILRK